MALGRSRAYTALGRSGAWALSRLRLSNLAHTMRIFVQPLSPNAPTYEHFPIGAHHPHNMRVPSANRCVADTVRDCHNPMGLGVVRFSLKASAYANSDRQISGMPDILRSSGIRSAVEKSPRRHPHIMRISIGVLDRH